MKQYRYLGTYLIWSLPTTYSLHNNTALGLAHAVVFNVVNILINNCCVAEVRGSVNGIYVCVQMDDPNDSCYDICRHRADVCLACTKHRAGGDGILIRVEPDARFVIVHTKHLHIC